MIVCNCNGLSERDVKRAILAGARNPCAVFDHHGAQPCCEKCIPEIDANIANTAASHRGLAEVA